MLLWQLLHIKRNSQVTFKCQIVIAIIYGFCSQLIFATLVYLCSLDFLTLERLKWSKTFIHSYLRYLSIFLFEVLMLIHILCIRPFVLFT